MNNEIKQTYDRIQFAMQKPDAYKAYIRKRMAEIDQANSIKNAVKRGEEIGEIRGEKRGEKKGEKRGIKKGVEIGIEKGKIEMILKLHNIGLPVDKIAEAAERPVNEVLSIVKKYKKKENLVAV